MGRCREVGARLFLKVYGEARSRNKPVWEHEKLHLAIRKRLFTETMLKHQNIVQRSYEIFTSGVFQDLTGQTPEQSGLSGPALSRRLY